VHGPTINYKLEHAFFYLTLPYVHLALSGIPGRKETSLLCFLILTKSHPHPHIQKQSKIMNENKSKEQESANSILALQ
jgi:hypothetical protein